MNTARWTLPVLFIFFGYSFLGAQAAAHIPGEILISLPAGERPEALIQQYRDTEGEGLSVVSPVSTLMNVWLLRTQDPFNNLSEEKALAWLRKQNPGAIHFAQYNHVLEERLKQENCLNTLPNDPLFPLQWQYINTGANNGLFDADLDADQAWDITTGGISPAGDTIVVAVIDGGLSYNHPDLAANVWRNWADIPGDGVDNDNNGYIDDFRGWNVVSGNDQIEGLSTLHGTPVSSIIGAKGNNGIGVSGVNWNVKILFISGSGTIANILSAFDYVRKTRKRYNDTHGASGAFVVAVNCSWGIDYGQAADAPLWCAAFDELGAEGILSVAATANNPVNVDEVGDLPTTCTSDYLISVTSLNKADQKALNAAWGPVSIDLGAYGHGIYTAGNANSYGTFEGTSFAAPQVTGALALLYSSPCPGLIALAKTQPAEAALWAKSLILGGVTPIPSMAGITATGGRLNLYNPLQGYEDQCNPCSAPFALVATDLTDTTALLKWVEAPDFQYVDLRWRKLGDTVWVQIDTTAMPFLLSGLNPCSNYEFALAAQCDQGLTSAWSDPFFFKTNGCCVAPDLLWATSISDSGVTLNWNPVNTAQKYRARIRPSGGDWQYYTVSNNALTINILSSCTNYEAQVQTICPGGLTAFSNVLYFVTSGCGACMEAAYCNAGAQNANSEWINQLQIGSWLLASAGIPGNGYLNFTSEQPVTPVFNALQSYPLSITPGFSGSSNKEYARIFIDYNGDGIFSGDELAFDPGFAQDGTISGQIVVPEMLTEGNTRMRVMMKATNDAAAAPESCETFAFGQVQDFCVELSLTVIDASYSPDSEIPQQLRIWPRPAKDLIHLAWTTSDETPALVNIWDTNGRLISSSQMHLPGTIDIRNWPSGVYALEVWSRGVVYSERLLK